MSELQTGCLFFFFIDTVASPASSVFFVSSFACFVASSPKDFLMLLQGNVFLLYHDLCAGIMCFIEVFAISGFFDFIVLAFTFKDSPEPFLLPKL